MEKVIAIVDDEKDILQLVGSSFKKRGLSS